MVEDQDFADNYNTTFLVDFFVVFLVPFTIWLLHGYVRVQSSPTTKSISACQEVRPSSSRVPSPREEETALLHTGSSYMVVETTYRTTQTRPPQLCPVHTKEPLSSSSAADTPTTYNSAAFSSPPSSSQNIHALVPPLSDALEVCPAPKEEEEEEEEEEEVWSASEEGEGSSEQGPPGPEPGSEEEQVLDEHPPVNKRRARAGPKGRARRRRYLQARMLEEMRMMEGAGGMSMQAGDSQNFGLPPATTSPVDHQFPKHQPVLHGPGQLQHQSGTTSNYAPAVTSSSRGPGHQHYVTAVEDKRGGHPGLARPGHDIIMAHLGRQGVLGPQHHRQFGPQGPREYGPGPHHFFPAPAIGHQHQRYAGGRGGSAGGPPPGAPRSERPGPPGAPRSERPGLLSVASTAVEEKLDTFDPICPTFAKRYLPRRTGSRPCSDEGNFLLSRPS